jgi:hypothetical protein
MMGGRSEERRAGWLPPSEGVAKGAMDPVVPVEEAEVRAGALVGWYD